MLVQEISVLNFSFILSWVANKCDIVHYGMQKLITCTRIFPELLYSIFCLCVCLLQEMTDIMNRLPPYQFLIAFSQLISRICHPNADVFSLLEVSRTPE